MILRAEEIPVVLFVFKRPEHTQRTIDSLSRNFGIGKHELIVFSDGPHNSEESLKVNSVRDIVSGARNFAKVTIHKNDKNMGLAASVISGLNKVFMEYEQAVILEDDLEFSPHFLEFMVSALSKYKNTNQVFSVSGYGVPIRFPENYQNYYYFSHRSSSWGWASWRDRWALADWEVIDYAEFRSNKAIQSGFNKGGADLSRMMKKQMDGEIDSWAIRWAYTHYKNNGLCLTPVIPLVRNTGVDQSGTHMRKTSIYDVELSEKYFAELPDKIYTDEKIMKEVRRFFKPTPIKRILNYFR